MKDSVDRVKRRIGYLNWFYVNLIGRGGGLALIWLDTVALEIVNHSSHHIHTSITKARKGKNYFLIGFYEQPDTGQRGESWQLIN